MGFREGLPYGLVGDTDAVDWEEILGMPKYAYEKEVADRYAALQKLGAPYDRDDVQRDYFNEVCPPELYTDATALASFYKSDLFAQLLVYEAPEIDLLQNLYQCGIQMAEAKNEPASVAIAWLKQRKTEIGSKPLVIVDNGFGSGYMGMGFSAALGDLFHFVHMIDFITPARSLLSYALNKYHANASKVFVDDAEKFALGPLAMRGMNHLVISHEVLEHTADPVAELHKMHDALETGGLLWLSTFFNSCNGKNPSHLTIHDKFQDTNLWFSEVKKAGFEHFYSDPRGVPKLFKAV